MLKQGYLLHLVISVTCARAVAPGRSYFLLPLLLTISPSLSPPCPRLLTSTTILIVLMCRAYFQRLNLSSHAQSGPQYSNIEFDVCATRRQLK
jgi:hypothetical protein